MRTARGMLDYVKEHGYHNGLEAGIKLFGEDSALKHFEVIEGNLAPDEEVLLALELNGINTDSGIEMGGIVAVAFTNKRLIYGQKSLLMGSRIKIVNLDYVSGVSKEGLGLGHPKIRIKTLKETVVMEIYVLKADEVLNKIVNIIEEYHSHKDNSSVKEVSVFDEVKKFKELLDMGIITQEEFDAKKKQLLNL